MPYNDRRRRGWHKIRQKAGIDALPPYDDLGHAFASLHIRAGISTRSRSR
jgi:hypothetical protein